MLRLSVKNFAGDWANEVNMKVVQCAFFLLFLRTKGIFASDHGRKYLCERMGQERNWLAAYVPRKKRSNRSIKFKIDEADPSMIVNGFEFSHCYLCDIFFRYNCHYEKHVRSKHKNVTTAHRCPHCPYSCGKRFSLSRHFQRVHPQKKDILPLEQVKFPWKETKCELCSKSFTLAKSFEDHVLKTHGNVAMIPCYYCQKKFHRYQQAITHQEDSHAFHPLKCIFCPSRFDRSDEIKTHEKVCEIKRKEPHMNDDGMDDDDFLPRYCETCQEEFQTYPLYVNHCLTCHTEQRIHICKHCGRYYAKRNHITLHIEKAHRQLKSKTTVLQSFQCHICTKTLIGATAFEMHGAGVHGCMKMFKCDECHNRFSRKDVLERHVRDIHQRHFIPFKCKFCKKIYKRLDGMKRHQVICRKKLGIAENSAKEGTYPQYCDICRRIMNVKEKSFRRHMREHVNFDSCPLCTDRFHRFSNPRGLEQHMRKRHEISKRPENNSFKHTLRQSIIEI